MKIKKILLLISFGILSLHCSILGLSTEKETDVAMSLALASLLKEDKVGSSAGSSSARVHLNTNFSIASASAAAIVFDTENFDTGNYWNSESPTRFTISSTGKYFVSAGIAWQNNGTGTRQLDIRKNGNVNDTQVVCKNNTVSGAGAEIISCGTISAFVSGDFVEAYGSQTSGGNLNAVGSAGGVEYTHFVIMSL